MLMNEWLLMLEEEKQLKESIIEELEKDGKLLTFKTKHEGFTRVAHIALSVATNCGYDMECYELDCICDATLTPANMFQIKLRNVFLHQKI